MRYGGGLAIIAAILVGGAAHAVAPSALQSTPGLIQPAADEMPGAAFMGRAFEAASIDEQLKLVDQALERLLRPTRFRGQAQCIRGSLLLGRERVAEARASVEECSRLLPDMPQATLLQATLLIGLDDYVLGADLMSSVFESHPELPRVDDPTAIISLLRRLSYAQAQPARDRLMLALLKAGYADAFPEELGGLAPTAIASRLAANDRPGAIKLLALVTQPEAAPPLGGRRGAGSAGVAGDGDRRSQALG